MLIITRCHGWQTMMTASSEYVGGTYRLGGNDTTTSSQSNNPHHTPLTARELRAQAAESRMTAEEEEIQEHCGCGRQALFLPPGGMENNSSHTTDNDTQNMDTT